MREGASVLSRCELPLLEALKAVSYDFKQIALQNAGSASLFFSRSALELNLRKAFAGIGSLDLVGVPSVARSGSIFILHHIEIVLSLDSQIQLFDFAHSKSPYKIIKRIITEIEIIKFIRGNLVISTSIILGRGGMNRTFA